MYVFIALFLTLFYALGVFCSGKCFSPDIFIVSVRHFKGKRVVGWLGGWVGNWGNWARGGEAAATHLCARQVGALSLWSRGAWHAPSIEEAVAFTGEVRTRRATSLSTIYQGSWNKKRVPLLIVNCPQFTEEVGAWRLWWGPATPPANNAQVDE